MSKRPLSPEHRAKLRAAKLGKPLSEEHKENIRAALKGRTFSPQHCARIGEASRQMWAARRVIHAP